MDFLRHATSQSLSVDPGLLTTQVHREAPDPSLASSFFGTVLFRNVSGPVLSIGTCWPLRLVMGSTGHTCDMHHFNV